MTAEIPAGIIAAPDAVKARLGTLRFFDGFPYQPSVEKLHDNLDFQHAVQADPLALPPVGMAGLREGLTKFGPANVTIPAFETLMDSRSIFLSSTGRGDPAKLN